jgi:malonyl-CoA decarboxylase
MLPSVFDQLMVSIADAGRDLLRGRHSNRRRGVEALAAELLSTRGEASGIALARELVLLLRSLPEAGRLAFFQRLASDFGPKPDRVSAAVEAYRAEHSPKTLVELREAAEAPRQELFRRMNMAPGGTRALVAMRARLLALLADHPDLREVDADLHHLLASWFNPGFLTLSRIDWDSPASLLEKLMRHERVHPVTALEALKRRLADDRRCFAFLHPALPDEPLIFVQVALTQGIPDRIAPLLASDQPEGLPSEADSAVFYSISNCQDGLRGVSLGTFLIKLVVESLKAELPQLRTFATLSPVPGFRAWLGQVGAGEWERLLPKEQPDIRAELEKPGWQDDPEIAARLQPELLGLCAHYLVREKRGTHPRDAVARFHLGNGARLERINWLADTSAKGMAESFGILVNYGYDPSRIEQNHEIYVEQGEVIHASPVRRLLPVLQPAQA